MIENSDELRARCDRALTLHGIRAAESFLAEIEAADAVDMNGEGGAVTKLEVDVGERLGKPAVVFMPSGTMAQQIALRIHADRRKVRAFGCHPTSHLELHEIAALFDRLRHRGRGRGGTGTGEPLWSLWPHAASALGAMKKTAAVDALLLRPCAGYRRRAARSAGTRDRADPPQTPAMHLHMRTTEEQLDEAVRALARKEASGRGRGPSRPTRAASALWSWRSATPRSASPPRSGEDHRALRPVDA